MGKLFFKGTIIGAAKVKYANARYKRFTMPIPIANGDETEEDMFCSYGAMIYVD